MKNLTPIVPAEFNDNVFATIGSDWMLVTAGNEEQVNTMTASWGGLGFMWAKNVAFVVIRPQRFTKKFIDENESFSLTFFDNVYKDKLTYLGKNSGKDENKIEKCGLTTNFVSNVPYFEEARVVVVCKKAFSQPMQENCFIDKSLLNTFYPNKDFHHLYICEIENIYTLF